MLFRISTRFFLFALIVLPLVAGCGSDSTTSGGGGNQGLSFAAGTYRVTFTPSACPPSLTLGGSQIFDLVVCQNTTWQQALDIPCAVTGDDTNIDIDCTYTDDNGLCSTTIDLVATGTKSGSTWTITGTETITAETPPGCSGNPTCEQFMVTVEELGSGTPSACSYGEANTVGAITNGPLGNVTMDAFGVATQGTVGWSWYVNAFYGTGVQAASSALNQSGLLFSMPEVATAGVPAQFDISILPPGAAASQSGGLTVQMSYFEQYTTGGYYAGESANTGTLTVQEVSADHVAGSYSVSMTGTLFTPPSSTTTATRTVQGNFHVRGGVPTLVYPAWPGVREALRTARVTE